MELLDKIRIKEFNTLDQYICQDLNSAVPLVNEVSKYIIAGGGKRIRPLITILCGKALNNSEPLLYKMAAMIEYIHTATLLHDDVVDDSNLRRGRKTANAIFGNAASVLVGDFIYTRAFQMMIHSQSLRVLQIMAESTNKISEGEVLQLLNIGRSDVSEEEYLKVIQNKTAQLFEAGARVAAVISNAPSAIEESLARYASLLGSAFQIIDDVLDYQGSAQIMGKNIGDDLKEGKVTLPLIYLLNKADYQQQELIRLAINQPAAAPVEEIVEIVKTSTALDYSIRYAERMITDALQALTIIEDNHYKEALRELAQASLKRLA